MLWSTAGVHPHHARGFDPSQRSGFLELLARPQVVAVGECGLDYYRDLSPRDAQRRAFQAAAGNRGAGGEAGVPAPARRACGFRAPSCADYAAAPRGRRGALLHGRAGELDAISRSALSIGVTGWLCDERRGRQPARAAAAHSRGAADDRDRRALPAAARPAARRPDRGATSRRICRTSRAPWPALRGDIAGSARRHHHAQRGAAVRSGPGPTRGW